MTRQTATAERTAARPPSRRKAALPALPGLLPAALLAALLAAACGKPSAFGQANSLIVVTSGDSLWLQVQDTTYAALEPTVFTVREEKKYYVEQVDTASTGDFSHLRAFTQVLVFGTPDNRWVGQVLEAADAEDPSPPAVVQARDVWARGQIATAVVLDRDDPAGSWAASLPELASRLDEQYRQFVRRRMFVSGPDSAASDSLAERFGFRLRFPRVYDVRVRGEGEGPVIVRNDNPDPSELIRSVLVDWRSPPLDTLTARRAVAWRTAVDSVHYGIPQSVDTTRMRSRRLADAGRPALEVTAVWSDEGTGYPAGGPFVARLIQCPERTYLLDAWLYAPGRDKYQYLVQLREILRSFRCSPEGG